MRKNCDFHKKIGGSPKKMYFFVKKEPKRTNDDTKTHACGT